MNDLLNLLKPPRVPFPTIPIDWVAKEAEFGRKFPLDYKVYIEKYGYGRISEDIIVFHPLGNKDTVNIFLANEYLIFQDDILRRKTNYSSHYVEEMREGKLYCWGRGLTGGSYFFWNLTDVNLHVVTYDTRGIGREDYQGLAMGDFIYGVLTNKIACEAVTEGISDNPVFESIQGDFFNEI